MDANTRDDLFELCAAIGEYSIRQSADDNDRDDDTPTRKRARRRVDIATTTFTPVHSCKILGVVKAGTMVFDPTKHIAFYSFVATTDSAPTAVLAGVDLSWCAEMWQKGAPCVLWQGPASILFATILNSEVRVWSAAIGGRPLNQSTAPPGLTNIAVSGKTVVAWENGVGIWCKQWTADDLFATNQRFFVDPAAKTVQSVAFDSTWPRFANIATATGPLVLDTTNMRIIPLIGAFQGCPWTPFGMDDIKSAINSVISHPNTPDGAWVPNIAERSVVDISAICSAGNPNGLHAVAIASNPESHTAVACHVHVLDAVGGTPFGPYPVQTRVIAMAFGPGHTLWVLTNDYVVHLYRRGSQDSRTFHLDIPQTPTPIAGHSTGTAAALLAPVSQTTCYAHLFTSGFYTLEA